MENRLDTQALEKIKVVALDIDGVMTDGSLIALPDGDLLRTYNAKDTFAVRISGVKGLQVLVLTGGFSESIHKRCLTLGVKEENIHMSCRGKLPILKAFCEENGYDLSEVMYFGDDIPDVPVLSAVGIAVAPADAAQEAKDAATYVSGKPGGRGCVREAIEACLKAQGKWVFTDYNTTF